MGLLDIVMIVFLGVVFVVGMGAFLYYAYKKQLESLNHEIEKKPCKAKQKKALKTTNKKVALKNPYKI